MIPGLELYLVDDEPARWARAFVRKLAAGRDVPTYGTSEWSGAPWDVQVAAAVRAGEVWRREGLTLPQRLEDELTRAREWLEEDERLYFAAVCRDLAAVPTHAELVRRRVA